MAAHCIFVFAQNLIWCFISNFVGFCFIRFHGQHNEEIAPVDVISRKCARFVCIVSI